MKHILTFILIALVGCSSLDKKIATSQMVGCYVSGDATRYNHAYLKVYDSGKYSIETVGDIGRWGTIEGEWSLKNNELLLVSNPTKSISYVVNPNKLFITLNGNLFNTLNNTVNYLSFDANQFKGKYSKSQWGVFEFGACEL